MLRTNHRFWHWTGDFVCDVHLFIYLLHGHIIATIKLRGRQYVPWWNKCHLYLQFSPNYSHVSTEKQQPARNLCQEFTTHAHHTDEESFTVYTNKERWLTGAQSVTGMNEPHGRAAHAPIGWISFGSQPAVHLLSLTFRTVYGFTDIDGFFFCCCNNVCLFVSKRAKVIQNTEDRHNKCE